MALCCAASFAQSPLANPDFEAGKPGERPPGWVVGNQAAYSGQIVAESCNGGKQCGLLQSSSAAAPFGTFLQSFDATGNVNSFTVPGGYTIAWMGMKVLKHDGSQHHGVGIKPTIPVSRTRAGIAAGRDEMLERALRAVRE